MVKDLSAFATPTLDVNLGRGREVSIHPPSVKDGAVLAAITTLGASIATGEVPETAKAMFEATAADLTEEDAKRLAVGDRYDWMVEQGWAWPDIDTVCRYATFYWVFGEAIADQIMDAEQSEKKGKKATSGKSRGRGKNGRRSA